MFVSAVSGVPGALSASSAFSIPTDKGKPIYMANSVSRESRLTRHGMHRRPGLGLQSEWLQVKMCGQLF